MGRGGELPGLDEHGGEEIVLRAPGTFTDQYRGSRPVTHIRGEAGSSHRPGTPDGVTFMVVRSLAPGGHSSARLALTRGTDLGSIDIRTCSPACHH